MLFGGISEHVCMRDGLFPCEEDGLHLKYSMASSNNVEKRILYTLEVVFAK